jgi:hypothetical protein
MLETCLISYRIDVVLNDTYACFVDIYIYIYIYIDGQKIYVRYNELIQFRWHFFYSFIEM